MATNQVKTRIVLRNDELANWEKSAKTLLSGEVALARTTNGKVEVRVGNGKTYSEALPLQISANQVVGLEGELASLSSTHYEVGSLADLQAKTGLNAGDTGVVKEQIADTGKYTYTAYVYDGEKWAAMDGNYDAENVYFNEDLTYTSNIGVLTVGSSGSSQISSKGKNLEEVLKTILAKEKNPTVTQPTIDLTTSDGTNEVGNTYNVPAATLKLTSVGSYQYGPATGVKVASGNAVVKCTTENTSITSTADIGYNGTLQLAAGAQKTYSDAIATYSYTAEATHTDGAVPKTNIGNDYAAGQIKSKTLSTTKKATFTGYRNSFYGTMTTKDDTVDSAYIRSLTGKSGKALANGNTFKINLPIGAQRVVFAYPMSLRDVSSVKDVNGLNAEIKSTFTKSTVQVEGANGYTAVDYKVYMTDFAGPLDKANSYTVQI